MKINLKQTGFSLIEMAIVMAILGLVFAGYMVGFGSFHHSAKLKESQSHEANIKKQILTFGTVNSFLPCPDTDGDGVENRIAKTGSLGTFDACVATVGTIPYLDVGLKVADVEDGWGNPIRYAVNRQTTDAEFICNKASSASMFCNAGASTNTYWFDLTNTPPTAADRGTGNYYVCNKSVAICSSGATDAQLETDTAVVVLVAYNEDGAKTIASMTGCAGIPSQNVDNCNIDDLYHQRAITVDDANFFDDVITSISGLEVKANLISKSISWNSFEPATAGPSPIVPTYTNFDISNTEYQADKDEIETSGDDAILVNRNVSEALNLGDGDDYIAIGNNLEAGANLRTGDGDDSVYIVNDMSSQVYLGDGNDSFVLGTNLTKKLDAGSGDDKVWIQGNINNKYSTLGSGDDVLWVGNTDVATSGEINKKIDGGSGTDILVLENYATPEEYTSAGNKTSSISNFEYVVFAADGAGNRQSCEFSSCSW